jgi:hypothetical protein
MTGRAWIALAAAAVLCACEPPTDTQVTEPAAPAPVALAEPLDPFVVSIDAQRWGVIIDRAADGAREAPDSNPALDQSDMYRADAALKSAAARVIELRNTVCAKGLLSGDACILKDWPAWTLEPPTGDTPISVIDQRSQWLSTVMSPFTEVGCDAGRKVTQDDLFCSVE